MLICVVIFLSCPCHPEARCRRAEADQRFLADTEWAQAAVRTDVVVPITQPQFDALVSLAYNIGAGVAVAHRR